MKSEFNESEELARIDALVKGSPVVIFMKGDLTFPMCGYSARAAEALCQSGRKITAVNVLTDPGIYEFLPRYADWETFPQIYISGALIGGCDIVVQLQESGDLAGLIEKAQPGASAGGDPA